MEGKGGEGRGREGKGGKGRGKEGEWTVPTMFITENIKD